MNDFEMRKILQNVKTIATVGFSTDPEKPSHEVPQYLLEHGYHVIPVNPTATEILGLKTYPDLRSIPEPVDLVQIFRPSDQVAPIVEQAIEIGAKVIWMQLGIVNPDAARRARDAGVEVIMDRCMKIERTRLLG